MIVKVCGITNLEDATRALDAGANALGFNFYARSPRYLEREQAETILAKLDGAEVLLVGVVVWHGVAANAGILPALGPQASRLRFPEPIARLTALQIHGLPDSAAVPSCGKRVFVAVSAEQAELFPSHEIIIDSSWGTGRVDDWNALRCLDRPYILSGGLTPSNVGAAIETLHPAGVDVCSGVESAPGRKDPEKLRQFMKEVRRVYGEF